MTSMPASRRARAMILAPRSCPSRPGLATTTRILRAVAASIARGRLVEHPEIDERRTSPKTKKETKDKRVRKQGRWGDAGSEARGAHLRCVTRSERPRTPRCAGLQDS